MPLLEEAAGLAVDAAVENGRPLLVANVIGGRYYPLPGMPVPEAIVLEEVEASLRAPSQLAAALGVRTERIRVLTPRPIAALVELVGERATRARRPRRGPEAHASARAREGTAGAARADDVPRLAVSGYPGSDQPSRAERSADTRISATTAR